MLGRTPNNAEYCAPHALPIPSGCHGCHSIDGQMLCLLVGDDVNIKIFTTSLFYTMYRMPHRLRRDELGVI